VKTKIKRSPREKTQARARLDTTLDRYCALHSELCQTENTNFRVCLFGSARIQENDPLYQTVFQLSRELAARGMDIVTGGGPGLMEAANAGVRAAEHQQSRSYGLTLDLPSLNEPPNPHLDIKRSHRLFSSRLDEFVRLSHAVVVAPGGIGTLLELVYVWQLLQIGMVEPRPVLLLGADFWRGLTQWINEIPAGNGFLSPCDMQLVQIVDSIEEVVAAIGLEQERLAEQEMFSSHPQRRWA
jgi:uncharacterized protein (TIGR00730 family)